MADRNTRVGFPKENSMGGGEGGNDEVATPGRGGAWGRHAQTTMVSWVSGQGVRSNVSRRHVSSCPMHLAKESGFYVFGSWKSLKLITQGSDKKSLCVLTMVR